jgi:hypothetical protein
MVNILGFLYVNQGKLMVAEEMFQRVLKGYGNALGLDRVSTQDVISNLDNLCKDQGMLKEAESLFSRLLVELQTHSRPSHQKYKYIIQAIISLKVLEHFVVNKFY